MRPYYERDGITLYHGDAREVLPALGRFDLVLTDPPYGIEYDPAVRKAIGAKNLDRVEGDDAPPPMDLILAAGKDCVVWGANNFPALIPHRGRWIVWDKRVIPSADKILGSPFELAWTSRTSGWGWIFRIQHGWRVNADQNGGDRIHPTQKPVSLMRSCLGLFPKAKTVVDPFAGSGSTLLAARAEGLKAWGIELREEYCERMAVRLSQGLLEL